MSSDVAEQTKPLTLEISGALATLTLHHGRMNAIDDVLLVELGAAFDTVLTHPGICVLRLRSERQVFSAGADLRTVGERLERPEGPDEMKATVRLFHRIYDRLAALPVVTIAEIEGHALGGGLELALACDIRVAAESVKLGLPEAKVGLLPGAGGTQRLTRLCGAGTASRIILTGDVVDGQEAQRLGMVQWVFSADEFQHGAAAIVARTASLSPDSLQVAKACMALALNDPERGVEAEIEGIWSLMQTDEARRRVRRFLGG